MKTIAQQLNIKEFPFVIRDKNRNIIYSEDSTGYWVRREFDSNGNIIYSEDSDGYWVRREFDSNGNIIYSETSEEYWRKWEYHPDGKLIYYENSHGYITDNRPKPCENKVVEIDGIKYKLTAL